jgi:multimeric flavodoxin WrbA
MKIITILGSPKRNGHTSEALDMLEKDLVSQGHETERINVIDYTIKGCLGCNACFMKKVKANCIQNDDAMSIFDRITSADTVVYAAPLYSSSFPAQMKPLIDRHYCLVTEPGSANQSSVIENKRVALLITCSRPEENNTDLIQEGFDRIFGELKCNIVGKYIIANSSGPNFTLNAKEITKTMSQEITRSK